MEDLVNSRAMVTTGVLGATTTMITGTLASQFAAPGNWTALIVSFVIGLLVWADKTVPRYQRIVLYLVSSLVIFTTAMGINAAGVAATTSVEQRQYQARWVAESEARPFFQQWF